VLLLAISPHKGDVCELTIRERVKRLNGDVCRRHGALRQLLTRLHRTKRTASSVSHCSQVSRHHRRCRRWSKRITRASLVTNGICPTSTLADNFHQNSTGKQISWQSARQYPVSERQNRGSNRLRKYDLRFIYIHVRS